MKLDNLTGYGNSESLNEILDEKIQIPFDNYPLTIFHFDVNFFMLFIDGQGHVVGDQVLITIGKSIFENIQQFKFEIFRFSDEFTVFVYLCNAMQAEELLKTIRKSIASHNFVINHPDQPETINEPLIVKSTYRVLVKAEKNSLHKAYISMIEELDRFNWKASIKSSIGVSGND